MFPNFNVQANEEIKNEEFKALGKTFKFDFENKRYVIENGRLVECAIEEAIEQWIYFILKTTKGKYKIYENTDFYCDIDDLIGKKPTGFIMSEMKREITESLKKHRYIQDVKDFEFINNKKLLNCNFTVVLIDNTEINIEG